MHVFVTLLQLISIYMSYKKKLWWKKTRGLLTKYDGMRNTGSIQFLLLEIVANLISPMPFLYDSQYNEYYYIDKVYVKAQVNTILLVLMLLIRIYHFARAILVSSYYMSDRAYRVSNIYGVHIGYRFALKSIFKWQPFIFVYTQYGLTILIFGYLFRAIEFEVNDGSINPTHFSLANSMWCSYITMTSIGYGDFYPKTILGR